MSIDVLISGAGPTGLLLGILLARAGVKFRIVDENSTRAQESRALAIQPRTLELFQSIGIIERILERGVRARGLSSYLKGKKLFDLDFEDIGRDDTPFPYVFFLSQSITEEILEDVLTELGVTVERNMKFDSFIEGKDEIISSVNQIEVRSKYLVGCDGAKSQVRKSLGLSFGGGTYESEFLLADTKVSWDLPEDRIQLFLGDTHLGLFMPLKGSEYSRVITVGKEANHDQAVSLSDIQAAFKDATCSDVKLDEARWVSRYRVHHRSVEKMQKGNAFVAGDAAHIHSPAGGQGMNTGLQDAANLAWKLIMVIKQDAPVELLETYNQERWPVAQHLLKYTDRLFGFASSLNVLIRTMRDAIAPAFAQSFHIKSIRKYLFGFISQLNIRYHHNKFIHEDMRAPRKLSRIRIGSRAPDAPLADKGSIFESIKGYQFHLLVMTRKKMTELERMDFSDGWRHQNFLDSGQVQIHWIDESTSEIALDRYNVEETLVSLIRPDGYIAYQRNFI